MVAGGGSEVTHCYRFSMLAAHNSFTLPCVCQGNFDKNRSGRWQKLTFCAPNFMKFAASTRGLEHDLSNARHRNFLRTDPI